MANTKMVMGLVLTLMAVLYSGAYAQSDCTNVLISMSPCLNYINGNSSTPSSQCCTQLANVVRSSPQCLCEVLNGGGSQLGIDVNQTQAVALPRACNVQTPPTSRCPGNGGSPADTPAGSPKTSGNGSKTVPSTEGDGSSDGSSIKLSFSLVTFLFTASYAVIFSTY